jgi:hypothetical protein
VPLDDVSGGETLFFWIQWAWIIAAAVVGTVIWSRSLARAELHIIACRGAVSRFDSRCAASMIEYGMTKGHSDAVSRRRRSPTLVTPAGDMSLSALLWTTIGSAPRVRNRYTAVSRVPGGVC